MMQPARSVRRAESGASLLLAMLVLFVLVMVMFDVGFRASVERDHVSSMKDTLRMRLLAQAAALQAEASLLLDADAAAESGADGGGGGGGGANLGGLAGGGGGGTGDGGGGGGASDVVAATDSRLDEWAHPESLAPPVQSDLDVFVEVIDEDSKINLLGLWAEDTDQAEVQREVVRRLLDRCFEGTDFDLGYAEADDILDKLDDWVKGRRGSADRVPRPRLKKSNAAEDAETHELDTAIFEAEAGHYPLTIGELALIEGVQPEHLAGFVQDDVFYPGIEEYLTVQSHLEVKPEVAEEEDSPFADSPFGETGADESDPEADDGELEVEPTNDGLVNVNTATLVVLRALAPEEISTSFLERVIEFRAKIEEFEDEGAGGGSLLDGGGGAFGNDDEDAADDEEPLDEDEDVTRFVFQDADELFEKIEEEFGVSPAADDEARSAFTALLGVTSQVFTIRITVVDAQTERRSSWRKTVWRMETGEEPRMITLMPLEPRYDPRRYPKDFPAGVQAQAGDNLAPR